MGILCIHCSFLGPFFSTSCPWVPGTYCHHLQLHCLHLHHLPHLIIVFFWQETLIWGSFLLCRGILNLANTSGVQEGPAVNGATISMQRPY